MWRRILSHSGQQNHTHARTRNQVIDNLTDVSVCYSHKPDVIKHDDTNNTALTYDSIWRPGPNLACIYQYI